MTNENKRQLVVWWFLWAALLSGIFTIYGFLGGSSGRSVPLPADSPLWLAGVAPFVASVIVRWVVLPRMPSAPKALPVFVVGMAIAESSCFLGLFLFPAHKLELFALSVVGILQFAPHFARRYFSSDDERASF
jgi:hypothetical protein